MKKRTFLKTSATFVAGGVAGSFLACSDNMNDSNTSSLKESLRTNWAGNLTYSAPNFHEVNSVEEVSEIVTSCDKVRVLGTKHCFNTIADSKFHQLSVRNLNTIIDIQPENNTVVVGAGASYGQICQALHQQGFALHNLASLPHISVAGACATATHGSGMTNGNLASAVSAIQFVDANGELVSLSREEHPDQFPGTVVHLGTLGVITALSLTIEPTYDVAQYVYQYLPVEELMGNFANIMDSGYSVSLFTDYQTDKVNQVWIKQKVNENQEQADNFYGATLAEKDIHPILELSAENCTQQMGVAGPWYDRLPHFKMEFTPSNGVELQTEYFVSLDEAPFVYLALSNLKELIAPYLMIAEIRSVAADDLWMSTAYDRQSVAFHFTWEQDWEGLQKVLPIIEQELKQFDIRPHWGKMFTLDPDRLQSLYPKLDDFKQLVAKYDPEGKFRNQFIEKYLYS